MFCSKCGAQNKAESKFCMSCGNALQAQVKTNMNSNQGNVNNGQPPQFRLGESPDFYTYLTGALVVLVLLIQRISPGVGTMIGLLAVITGLIGLRKTTNRILHIVILLLAAFIMFLSFGNYTDTLM